MEFQMFHQTAKSSTASKEKPAWLPSGFSTGLPPAHYTHTFCDYTQMRPSTGFSSMMPKSNTLGAIAEMETSTTIPASTSSFDNMQQHAPHSNSYASIPSNPFVQQPFGGVPSTQRDQSHLPNSSTMMMSNPFAVPYHQARFGTDSLQSTGSAQSWNPFV
ncbi:hypothetical protein KIN20_008371 [Parelaphostrongylus tenuis]|uniref:Uncharacterized protein n=1 Tax=Parelaphostrongylus tenuis TaxID=148309 RepID=A0AAD5QIW2_PARTN|nr:hypothetical protein KIN20_008371 [Parelaphostrongylus tenuis]